MTNQLPSSSDDNRYIKLIKKLQLSLKEQSFSLKGLFIIALLYTCYFARDILLTVVLALFFYFILSPLVGFLKRIYIRPEIGALIVIVLLALVISYGFYELSFPATEWFKKAPSIFTEVNHKLEFLTKSLRKFIVIFENINTNIYALTKIAANEKVQPVEIQTSYFVYLFGNTGKFFVEAFLSLILTYFLLASEDFILRKVIKSLENLGQKKDAVFIARQTAYQINIYLIIRTLINIVLALVTALLLYLFGVPNPILLGIMTGIFAFIPYLGAMVSTIIIVIVSILSFSDWFHIIILSALFFTILMIEGNFIAPYMFGKSLTLPPMAIFFAIIFWGWIWGIAGAFMAVPLVVTFKIIIDNVDKTSLVNELLSD